MLILQQLIHNPKMFNISKKNYFKIKLWYKILCNNFVSVWSLASPYNCLWPPFTMHIDTLNNSRYLGILTIIIINGISVYVLTGLLSAIQHLQKSQNFLPVDFQNSVLQKNMHSSITRRKIWYILRFIFNTLYFITHSTVQH